MKVKRLKSERGRKMMLMTVKEARDIWCPHARIAQSNVPTVSFNRAIVVEKDKETKLGINWTHCLGNKCAAWRWADNKLRDIDPMGEVPDRRGYCGAFGKPEMEE